MSLWGKTDAEASRPKWIDLATQPAGTELIFVDETEAKQEGNKAIGLTGAGWWLYRTYTDAAGATRHKSELLVALSETALAAGDADTIAVNRTIAITTQPLDSDAVSGSEVTFTVVAAATPATTLTYQWGLLPAGSADWEVIVGATSASYVIADNTGLDGNQYRVVVSAADADPVMSNTVTLTETV